MQELTQQLTQLRNLLVNANARVADSFSKVFDRFFDIVEATPLVDESQPFEDPRIQGALENVTRVHTKGRAVGLAHFHMLHHAPSSLVHGRFVATRHPATYFFFLDELQGVVAFVGKNSMTDYYRMTLTELVGSRCGPDGSPLGADEPSKAWPTGRPRFRR